MRFRAFFAVSIVLLAGQCVVYAEIMHTGNIGMRVLQDFKITFDQKNARMRLER